MAQARSGLWVRGVLHKRHLYERRGVHRALRAIWTPSVFGHEEAERHRAREVAARLIAKQRD